MKMRTMKMRTSRYKAAFDAMLCAANVKEIFYENLKNIPIEDKLTINQFFLKIAPHNWVKKSFRWTAIEQKLKKREIKNDT